MCFLPAVVKISGAIIPVPNEMVISEKKKLIHDSKQECSWDV